jgi:hypothetical protein
MTTVASISFNSNKSISMDIENVTSIELAPPVEAGDGTWACELFVRSKNGVVALQLTSANPDKLQMLQVS